MLSYWIMLAGLQTGPEVKPLLDNLRLAVSGGTRAKIEEYFVRKDDAAALATMAANRGGFRNLKVAIIPAPNGWSKSRYWAVFHAPQDIENETDKIYEVVLGEDGCQVGRQIPYLFDKPYVIEKQQFDVKFSPETHGVTVHSDAKLKRVGGDQTLIFGLGDSFQISRATIGGKTLRVIQADDQSVPQPASGDLVRAGSLMIVWGPAGFGDQASFTADYTATINSNSGDKITAGATYLTAWWAPTIAQLPYTTEVAVTGPNDWIIRSEGVSTGTNRFRCDVPIAFPKIIAGRYTLAAEKTELGKTFRAYQLGTVDKKRGETDVDKMAAACAFYTQALGPFPFPHYEVFDADTYYGIESYSYTLLGSRFTTRFVTHEMGHTYFGGLVPCAYLKDTWNESLTQYVDSVLFSKNADRTLENGLRTLNVKKPLSKMWLAWADGNATYMRGAYVMRMLENEIGLDKVLVALKEIVKDRVGKETIWADLRPYFERASGKNLDWFWSQWIDGSNFPTVTPVRAEVINRDGRFTTMVKVSQKETENFRLRFLVRLTGSTGQKTEKVVVLGAPSQEFPIDSDFKPVEASVDVFQYCLGVAGETLKIP